MNKISLLQKIVLCLIGGFLSGQTFLRVSDFFLGKILPPPALIIPAFTLIAASLIYLFIWFWRDKKGAADNHKIKTFWISIIRYGVAFDLAMFGFQKIFHMQSYVPMGMLDEPFNNISSRWLTWGYFGHSYGFLVAIGLLQILGSIFLTVNRTRLLGVIVLIPIMMSIVLIDYFYELETGVLIHAITVMAGLLYLLAMDYQLLLNLFLKRPADNFSFPVKYTFLKYVGRLSIVFIPSLIIAFKPSPDKHPELTGKYEVTRMNINGKPVELATCDSLLTVVYFDIANDCVFEFNGYKRRMYGSYSLNEEQGTIHTQWFYPETAREKTFAGVLKKGTGREIELIGMIQQDSVRVKLTRAPAK